jgi:calcineurin-like phosphoesterase family protein
LNIKTNILDKITPEIKTDLERIWFTADLHHNHDGIILMCARPCSQLMHEEWIVESINSYVKKKDVCYYIGDISFASKIDTERFLDRLNGEKFLIIGNHDKNLRSSSRFTQIIQIKDFTYSKFDINIHIVLCHYPFVTWNRKPYGSWHISGLPWNLYGHVHGRFNNNGLSIDVGIDNPMEYQGLDGNTYTSFRKPINLYEVIQIMAEKERNLTGEEVR